MKAPKNAPARRARSPSARANAKGTLNDRSPSGPTVQTSGEPTDLCELWAKTQVGILDRIEAEFVFAKAWNETKIKLKFELKVCQIRWRELRAKAKQEKREFTSAEAKAEAEEKLSLTVNHFIKCNKLPFTHQNANGCARALNVQTKFYSADQWYRQSGFAHGWQTTNAAGWEYVLEVVKLHERSKSGETPDGNRSRPEPTSRHNAKVVMNERDDLDHENAILIQAFDEVCQLYRQTPAGTTYENAALVAAKAARKIRESSRRADPEAQQQVEQKPQ